MAVSTWRAHRSEKARARLMRNLPEVFPGAVLVHALSRPFLPATPRRTVDSYWRYNPIRADKLARALAALSGTPDGWVWRAGIQKSGRLVNFRAPPTPFREPAYTKGPGHCCVCGQPIFRFGWHRDLWGDRRPNQNATWHSCCVAAWNLWVAPSDHVQHLKVLQKRRCLATGERLLKNAEVDHRVPLFKVWRATIAIVRGLHCWPSGASLTCRSSIDPLTWRSAPKRRASAGPMKWTPEGGQSAS